MISISPTRTLPALLAALLVAAPGQADDPAERLTVPLSDPARPATVSMNLLNGGIDVTGSAVKQVIVELHGNVTSRQARRPENTEGLKRVDIGGSAFGIEEAANVVEIKPSIFSHVDRIGLEVPRSTNLKLKTLSGGDINVSHIDGDIEVENLNGEVKLSDVSGASLIHTLNGKIVAVFSRVPAGKSMSLSSLNGDVDITLPANAKFNVRAKTDNGAVYSGFEMKLQPYRNESQDASGGTDRHRRRVETGTYGTINGGGPDLQLTTFNGNIYIRQAH